MDDFADIKKAARGQILSDAYKAVYAAGQELETYEEFKRHREKLLETFDRGFEKYSASVNELAEYIGKIPPKIRAKVLAEALASSCSWSDTPEGFKFWRDISQSLHKKP